MLHRPAMFADVVRLSPILRPEDKAEMFAATGKAPLDALREGFNNSEECHVFLHPDDGGVIGMFGVGNQEGAPWLGVVWAVASPRILSIKEHLTVTHKGFMDRWHEKWPVLGNFIDERNALHIKWIVKMGYVLGTRIEKYGYEQRPFIAFAHQREET
jgi:hypothetical protein